VIVNLPITPGKCHRTTLWNAELIHLMEGILFLSKHWWLWKGEFCCVALVAVKRADCVVIRQAASQQVFKVTTFCTDIRFQPFLPLINCIVHHSLLKFSPCLNNLLPQLVHIADWYLISYTLLHHTPDAAINRAEVMTVGWPHVGTDELGCLTAQELDCVTSTMCWRVVLEEDKHVSSKQCCVLLAAALASATRLNSTVQVTVSKQLWVSCTVTVAVHFILR